MHMRIYEHENIWIIGYEMIEDMKLQRREPTDLWRFVNGAHSRSDAEWNGGMLFIDAVHETGALISRPAPIVEKAIYDARILEHDVVDVTVRLTIQSHGTEKEGAIFLKSETGDNDDLFLGASPDMSVRLSTRLFF